MEADVKRKTVETALAELDADETLFMDGLDNAIIGIACRDWAHCCNRNSCQSYFIMQFHKKPP